MEFKDFLEKYGNKKKIEKWDFLYKASEEDKNLYYILQWKLILSINWENIAIVWEKEINGEKSFLEKKAKPIDAIAKTNLEVLCISPENFEKIDSSEKINFLKQLVLFVSNRVYLLNDIISNLSSINEKLISFNARLDLDYIKSIFSFIKLDGVGIYKILDENTFISIFETSIEYQNILENYINKDFSFETIDDFIILKVGDYLVLLNTKEINYVVNNVLIHSLWNIKYLCYMLENEKEKCLSSYLD